MAYRENMVYSAKFGITQSTFTVSSSIDVYGINSSGGAITATLPPAASVPQYKAYIFKDIGAQASSNNITIDGDGSETIDGQTTQTISTNGGALTIISDGANWSILSKYP
jgi:hypothetical protein